MDSKVKYDLEVSIQSSPQLLYQYISTPSGLSEWFADNVNFRGEIFTFIWDEEEAKAKLISKSTGERVKFRWVNDDGEAEDTSFFEIKILVDELTNDVSVLVTDFAEPDEVEDAKMLWEKQLSNLKHVLGSV